jgi:hypothetical protein
LPGGNSASAKRAHPLSSSRNGAGDTPAHYEKRNHCDKEDIDQGTEEGLAPNAAGFSRNIFGVMDDSQATDGNVFLIRSMEGHDIDVNPRCPNFLKSTDAMILVQRLGNNLGRAGQDGG